MERDTLSIFDGVADSSSAMEWNRPNIVQFIPLTLSLSQWPPARNMINGPLTTIWFFSVNSICKRWKWLFYLSQSESFHFENNNLTFWSVRTVRMPMKFVMRPINYQLIEMIYVIRTKRIASGFQGIKNWFRFWRRSHPNRLYMGEGNHLETHAHKSKLYLVLDKHKQID